MGTLQGVVEQFTYLGMFAVLVLGSLGLSGCASTEPDNLSERPWNTPKGWENGLPSGMTEGR